MTASTTGSATDPGPRGGRSPASSPEARSAAAARSRGRGNRREYVLGMADETTLVNDRIGQLLDEIDPRGSTVEEFRSRQFDLGLAWVSFPEGFGGLNLPAQSAAGGRPATGPRPAPRRPGPASSSA